MWCDKLDNCEGNREKAHNLNAVPAPKNISDIDQDFNQLQMSYKIKKLKKPVNLSKSHESDWPVPNTCYFPNSF